MVTDEKRVLEETFDVQHEERPVVGYACQGDRTPQRPLGGLHRPPDADRALSNSITLTRVASGMSFFVLNMLRLLVRVLENGLIAPGHPTGRLRVPALGWCRTGR